MFSFLKRPEKTEGVTGVALARNGFALTHIVWDEDDRPNVDVCEYWPCDSSADLQSTLTSAVKARSLEGTECVCVPPPGHYSLRLIDAPPVEPHELREAARWSIKDLVDFPVDDAVIDIFDMPESDSPQSAARIYVVAAPNSTITKTVKTIEGSGLKLKAIDVAELALRNVAALLHDDYAGVALMFLGSGIGVLTVTREGRLYLARGIEADLEELEGTEAYELEELKPDASEEAVQILDALVLEAQRSLDCYQHQLRQDPIATLFVAPLESPVPALIDYLSKHLAVEVRMLDLNDVVRSKQRLTGPLQARCLPAIGAALRREDA